MDNGECSYRRFLSGDDSGMEELVRDHKDGLMLYLRCYTGSIELAEECVQDTFIRLATKCPGFRGKSSFRTWLYAIGRNIAIDRVRKYSRHISAALDECSDISAETDIEREYLIEEQKISLHRAMRKLKPDYQQVLWLTYFEGFSNTEAAKILGKSKKQTENLLYNAKKYLRSQLERDGFLYEEL